MPLKPTLPSLNVRLTHQGTEITSGSFQQSKILIGRSSDCDIVLRSFKYVSRHHLTLFLQRDSVRVVDGNSTVGTSYLGEKITSVEIASKGVFKIHDINVEVTFQPARALEKTHLNINVKEFTKTASLLMQINSGGGVQELGVSGSSSYGSKKSSREIYSENSYFFDNHFFGCSGRLHGSHLSLRVSLVWNGQVIDSHIFKNNQHIVIAGDSNQEGLFVPGVNFALQSVGYVLDDEAHICVANGTEMYISKAHTEPEFTQFDSEEKGSTSGMLELDVYDRCFVLLNDKLGISYEFVDTSEQLTSSILRKEDHDFFVVVRNVIIMALIIAGTLVMFSDSKVKSKKITSKKERVVQVVIPAEKKEPPKPEPPKPEPPKPEPPKPEPPKPEPPKPEPPKPKPPKPKPPKPKLQARPKPKPKVKKRISKSVTKPRPSLRLSRKPKKSSSPRSSTPKVQKPTSNALAAFASFNKLNTLKPGKVSSNFKIDPKSSKTKGVSQGQNLIASLNKSSQARPGSSSGKSALSDVSTDFSSKNLSAKTGKRGVKGAPVGPPKLLNSSGGNQGLSSKQVMAVVKKHLSAVQRCYERALFNQPNLSGRIEYEWTISPKGKVKTVGVRRSEASGDKALNDCVKKVFRKMKFPSATNGQSTVTSIGFPFGKL